MCPIERDNNVGYIEVCNLKWCWRLTKTDRSRSSGCALRRVLISGQEKTNFIKSFMGNNAMKWMSWHYGRWWWWAKGFDVVYFFPQTRGWMIVGFKVAEGMERKLKKKFYENCECCHFCWTMILIWSLSSLLFHCSPPGNVLRTIGDIKDYLLTAGTCKCGLPCPFRPELFFNFDSQVSGWKYFLGISNGIEGQ